MGLTGLGWGLRVGISSTFSAMLLLPFSDHILSSKAVRGGVSRAEGSPCLIERENDDYCEGLRESDRERSQRKKGNPPPLV